MVTIVNLEERLGGESEHYRLLKILTRIAILDESESIRRIAINALKKAYDGRVTNGFERDGYLYLTLSNRTGHFLGCVCPVPKMFRERPSVPIAFRV